MPTKHYILSKWNVTESKQKDKFKYKVNILLQSNWATAFVDQQILSEGSDEEDDDDDDEEDDGGPGVSVCCQG